MAAHAFNPLIQEAEEGDLCELCEQLVFTWCFTSEYGPRWPPSCSCHPPQESKALSLSFYEWGNGGKEGRGAAQGPRADLRPPAAGGWGSGHCPCTHGPDSTWMEPTFSSRLSVRLGHSAESSHRLPWKFSNSYTVTWKDKDERLAPGGLQGP